MVRSSCISVSVVALLAAGSAFAQNTNGPGPRTAKAPYTVDGLALGVRIDAQSPAYRAYQCSPSEQFPEFTRCQRSQRQQGGWGRRPFDASSSILHGADGKAVYINHYIGPWTFDRNEIQTEINRLSGRFGEHAREMRMPQREGQPFGIIALWGQVQLEPLDGEAVAVLASGESPRKGLLIDYLGDLRRSAQLALPIYSIRGGAGYLWSASADRNARGHIRFLAVDASAFSPAVDKPQLSTETNTETKTELKTTELKTAELNTTELNTEPGTSEAVTAGTPQPSSEIGRAESQKTSVDNESAKAGEENAPVSESVVASATEVQPVTAADRAKLDALVARVEAQLARAEAINHRLETWAYRTIAALVLLLIVAGVVLRAWRRKARATAAQASKTAPASKLATVAATPIAIPQVVQQSAGSSAPSLVPQMAPQTVQQNTPSQQPAAAAAQSRGKTETPQAQASDIQPCSSGDGENSRAVGAHSAAAAPLCFSCREQIGASDAFCRHCGAASVAVASPSVVFNGERSEAGEKAVQAALFGDAKPA